MSVRAINWAFEQEVAPVQKVILLALADWADGDGVAYPGQKSLVRKTSIPERTLRRALQELEEAGLLTRRRRTLDNGVRTSDEYQLLAGQPANMAASQPANPVLHNRPTVAATGEPSVEPSVTATARARTMPMDLTWSNAHSIKAGSKGVDVDVEFAKFQDYHLARGSKFVDWERAFHTWLNNARPDIGRGSQRPDSRPSRDEEIMAFLASPTPRQEYKPPAIERPKTTECPFCPELFEDDGAVMRHIHRDHPEGN